MCGHCHYCQTGRPQLCVQSLKSLFTLPDGTVRTRDSAGKDLNVFCGCGVMAEFATVHMDNVVKIDQANAPGPGGIDRCGVMTGVGAAVNTAKVEAGSIAVVFGCGGVGLNAIQGCAIAGAGMIVAVDTSDAKLEHGEAIRRDPRLQHRRPGECRQGSVQAHAAAARTMPSIASGTARFPKWPGAYCGAAALR